MMEEKGNSSSVSIRVGEEFSLTGNGVHKGMSKTKDLPYIFVIKKAERGFSSLKMFIHNASECLNAQKVKVKKIIDVSAAPRKAPNGNFYSEYKITADCEPFDILADERKKTADDFEMFVNTDDVKPDGGLFDKYSDWNDLPFV